MIHPCAGCQLRFRTSGELASHIREEHLEHPAQALPERAPAVRGGSSLSWADYSRSGWVTAAPAAL